MLKRAGYLHAHGFHDWQSTAYGCLQIQNRGETMHVRRINQMPNKASVRGELTFCAPFEAGGSRSRSTIGRSIGRTLVPINSHMNTITVSFFSKKISQNLTVHRI